MARNPETGLRGKLWSAICEDANGIDTPGRIDKIMALIEAERRAAASETAKAIRDEIDLLRMGSTDELLAWVKLQDAADIAAAHITEGEDQ